ncbi:hypothetical protein FraQA3DRAFT_1825 [Frankia sp. QA3]|nr:hypothetical protein FraQA3DRAFT_1825 [Frankia sp. QA3]
MRPAATIQLAEPASPDLFENPCDTTGGGVAPLATSCRPVTPDQTCWQSGNRYTDRYDDTQARLCAQNGIAGASSGGALESCTPNSFDGDTAVLMADGTHKAVREAKVGGRVLATRPPPHLIRIVEAWTWGHTMMAVAGRCGAVPRNIMIVGVGSGRGLDAWRGSVLATRRSDR